jgi:hypothetical protein
MHYLIAGLAKSGTTRLFSQLQDALLQSPLALSTFFEPDSDEALAAIRASAGNTLTKVLIGRVSASNTPLHSFERHVLIYRDPRDQFLSMLLYLFYDFQLSGDTEAYRRARDLLAEKIAAPASVSTIALYSAVAELTGRAPIGVFKRLHSIQRDYEEAFSPFMLRYEELVAGSALASLSNYLDLPLGADTEVPTEYARVARSRGFGEWRAWLNEEDLLFIDREWGENIQRLGYVLEPAATAMQISPQTSLDYVAQFDPKRSRSRSGE